MRTKTKIFIAVLSLFVVLALIAPIFLYCDIDKALTLGTNLVGAVSGIGTLVIAFLLFDRFGIGKRIIDKKVDVVIELVEELKGKRMTADSDMKDGSRSFQQIYLSQDMTNHKEEMLNDTLILVDIEDYMTGTKELLRLKNNVWMPKEIRNQMKFLELYSTEVRTDMSKFDNNQSKIGFTRVKKEDKNWAIKNDQDTTYLELIENFEKLFETIQSWLNKHTNIDFDLNT